MATDMIKKKGLRKARERPEVLLPVPRRFSPDFSCLRERARVSLKETPGHKVHVFLSRVHGVRSEGHGPVGTMHDFGGLNFQCGVYLQLGLSKPPARSMALVMKSQTQQ